MDLIKGSDAFQLNERRFPDPQIGDMVANPQPSELATRNAPPMTRSVTTVVPSSSVFICGSIFFFFFTSGS